MRAVIILLTLLVAQPALAERSGWHRVGDALGVSGTAVVFFFSGTLVGLVTTGPLAARFDEPCPQQVEPLSDDDIGCLDKRYGLLGVLLTGAAAAALAPLVYDVGLNGEGDLGATYLVLGSGVGLTVAGIATESDTLFSVGMLTSLVGPVLTYALLDDEDPVQPVADWRPDGRGGQQLMLGLGGRF